MYKILVIRLYFLLEVYMFRTVLIQRQEQYFISYSHTTTRRIVPAYTKSDVQLIKLLLMMD